MTQTTAPVAQNFDMSHAWETGVALLRANSRVIFVLAGVFFFLPVAALLHMLPDLGAEPAFAEGASDPQAMSRAINLLLAEIWWMILIVMALQAIGSLALYRLLTDKARPTVAEALRFGAIAFLPYLAAIVLAELARLVVVGIPTTLLGAVGLGGLGIVIGFVATIYLYVKFSLIAPVVGIEKQTNPFRAIRRSWQLTKGNSLRLFLFYFLLVVAFLVLWMVATLILTLIFGLMGPQVAGFGFVLSTAAAVSIFWAVFLGVLTATHGQLSGSAPPSPWRKVAD